MSLLSRSENKAIFTHGMIILSNNPLSHPYFCEHFKHVVDFFNNATLTYTYDDNPEWWDILYSHYAGFLRDYTGLFWLHKESDYLRKEWNKVTVSLVVVVMEHLKWKMQVNTDILKPLEQYSDSSMNTYIKQYFENQKTIYDTNLKNLVFTVEEEFTFAIPKIKDLLEQIATSSNGYATVDTILNGIRYEKSDPERKGELREIWIPLDTDTVTIERKVVPNNILAYYMFNLIFLDKQYYLYRSGELIRMWNEVFSDRLIVDKFTLDQIIANNNSWTIIQCSLPQSTFTNFLDDQQWFRALKEEILQEYSKLTDGDHSPQKQLDIIKKIQECCSLHPAFQNGNFAGKIHDGKPIFIEVSWHTADKDPQQLAKILWSWGTVRTKLDGNGSIAWMEIGKTFKQE